MLGAEIGIKQAAVSRLEGREDMLVSTLRDRRDGAWRRT